MVPENVESKLKVVIAAEHASLKFGGEAALPLHYFRLLLSSPVEVHLVTHARVRQELQTRFPDASDRIHYIEDSGLHRWMWRIGKLLPARLSYFTTGFVSRLSSQLKQRNLIRGLIRSRGIQVVHQPMPVSPREPSVLFDLGVPVVIGPMNGGMTYPPAFRNRGERMVSAVESVGRRFSGLLNRALPGKRQAALLLVANQRTAAALPAGLSAPIELLVENGVDLDLWTCAQAPESKAKDEKGALVQFIFLGRLVDWKAVHLALAAFHQSGLNHQVCMSIVGDGPELGRLTQQAHALGILGDGPSEPGKVWFAGWRPQEECASLLRQHDVLLLPSLWECGGAVVLEAMASGRPVIATNWGGPADYLDARCGRLIDPISPEYLVSGMAAAMRELAGSVELRQALGRAGRARVEADFDWAAKVQFVLGKYVQVIELRAASN